MSKSRDPAPIWACEKLKSWRVDRGYTGTEAAAIFNVSVPTYFRYENGGYLIPIDMANVIVVKTFGKVRYRDMYWNFHPEYA